jgi:hypothetical protein
VSICATVPGFALAPLAPIRATELRFVIGAAAALGYVRTLHARDNYPLLDDSGCYLLIASTDTALRRLLKL